MYAITGITGNVGGAMARALLAAGKPVRAVVRDAAKGRPWAALGCEVAVAHLEDVPALTAAFSGVTGAFVLPPSEFDPAPGFPEAKALNAAIAAALSAAQPPKVVCLSTIGAQAKQANLLSQRTLLEQALAPLPSAVTFLRPAWFMENLAWDIEQAKTEGTLSCFLQPLGRALPMVATEDVGNYAAELIQESWIGQRIAELEGPRWLNQHQIAATLSELLGRPVQAQIVPRETWLTLFEAQGMKNPEPRIQMLDGFNHGWIRFEGEPGSVRKGKVELKAVLARLIGKTGS
ncbi:MAG: NmrA family NAD(P)-binding protein [Myxococcales bacterium]